MPPRARQDPQRDFGQPRLARTASRDAQIGRQSDLQPAPDAVAAQGRDHQLGRVLEAQKCLVGVQAEGVLEGRRDVVEHPDVRAGAEELLALPTKDHHLHGIVEARLQDGFVQVTHHLVGVAVGGRVRQGQEGHAVLDGVGDLPVGHGPGVSEAHDDAGRGPSGQAGRVF